MRFSALGGSLSSLKIFFYRQEPLGAKKGGNRHVSGLIYWLGQQKTVNASVVVVLSWGGGVVLPRESGETDNDRMSVYLEKYSFRAGSSWYRHSYSLVVVYEAASTPLDLQGIT